MKATLTGRAPVIAPCAVSDLMTDNPLSISSTATAQDAVKLLTEHQFSAAPVIDEVGHPVGVISRTDLVDRLMRGDHLCSLEENWFDCESIVGKKAMESGEYLAQNMDYITVGEIMTPTVISVSTFDSIDKAVELMLDKEIHRLFVVDKGGILVGVLSPFDILRHYNSESGRVEKA